MLRAPSRSAPADTGKVELAIVHFADGWRIFAGRQDRGRFAYRVDAEEAALRLSEKARREGQDVNILVQARFGELQQLEPV